MRQGRQQRLADLLVARCQIWLLLPQLGEQRLGAELGMSQPQSADGLQEAVGHASPPRPQRRQRDHPAASSFGRHLADCNLPETNRYMLSSTHATLASTHISIPHARTVNRTTSTPEPEMLTRHQTQLKPHDTPAPRPEWL